MAAAPTAHDGQVSGARSIGTRVEDAITVFLR